MATKKLKSKAAIDQPQTRDEAAAYIHQIGALSREHTRLQTEMNDAIATITATFQPRLDAIAEQLKPLQTGVQIWCEANRAELTDGGKVKFAKLITGMVTWRQRPPSVSISNLAAVLKALKTLDLQRYIRQKEEVDKDAILAALSAAQAAPTSDPKRAALVQEAERVQAVAGIKVVTGVEDFSIEPFEASAEALA